ncbi:protein-methionine-sulfoxide reductase heme-binding subunit MsrQ [Allomesorhizobium camelthorni]
MSSARPIRNTSKPRSGAMPRYINRAIYLVGMMPATWTFYLGVIDQLGADPMKTLERSLGLWALRFLIITLTITPLRDLSGVNLLRYRRALGLLAFFYALMHLSTYLVLDQGLDLDAIWADILKRPYITIGMLSFATLVPLAITSNNAMIRRLGGAAWARLHRWVYLAAGAAAVHYLLVVKSWTMEPVIYTMIVAVLLAYRVARRLRGRRRVTLASA